MIYLDHASTTYVYPEVIEKISNILQDNWGNPSNIYKFGVESKLIINSARTKIADALHCSPEEIFFTSGASEGNAWALAQRKRCLSSVYEHHNITENAKTILIDEDYLERIDKLSYSQQVYLKNIYKEDYLYSHMYVSNETGEIFNIAKLFKKPKEFGMLTHCDMTQAIGNIAIQFDLPTFKDIDIATFSGHKIHAPKGIGFVYIKEDKQKNICPLLYGGIQEKNLRAGTENIPYIAGLGIAVEKATKNAYNKNLHCLELRNYAIKMLEESKIPYIINEGATNLNSTLNFCLPNIEGEVIQYMVSESGIFIGTGSACGDGTMEVSKTLKEMGVPEDYIHGEIRLSFDISNTIENVKIAMQNIFDSYKKISII